MNGRSATWVPILLAFVGGQAGASHDEGCVPTAADPSTINQLDLTGLGGTIWYVEERARPLTGLPPIPSWGLLVGSGTWVYTERNEILGLQRGFFHPWPCFPPPPHPVCILLTDPGMWDETCGHGTDQYTGGLAVRY